MSSTAGGLDANHPLPNPLAELVFNRLGTRRYLVDMARNAEGSCHVDGRSQSQDTPT